MKSRLLHNLSKEDENEIKRLYEGSYTLRQRYIDLLEKDIESVHASMRDQQNYDSPAWPYLQAEKIARVKEIQRMIDFLK
jgi:hypothetical protein